MIQARGDSRLNELRKPKQSLSFSQKYIGGGSLTTNGVDYGDSVNDNNVVYYIDGLKYNDKLNQQTGAIETFIYYNSTPSIQNMLGVNQYKSFIMDGEYTQPKITNDVFIFRQDIAPFKDNYMLEGIFDMLELTTFAGGGYFTIKENS